MSRHPDIKERQSAVMHYPPPHIHTNFGKNIGIKWKILGCTHFPEIRFHPQIFDTNIRIELKMLGFIRNPEIYFHPPNVWHRYHDKIKNVWFYKHSRIGFSTSPIHSENTQKVQRQKLCFRISVFLSPPHTHTHTHPHTQTHTNVWYKYQDRLKNVGLYTIPRNMSPKCQVRMKNVRF